MDRHGPVFFVLLALAISTHAGCAGRTQFNPFAAGSQQTAMAAEDGTNPSVPSENAYPSTGLDQPAPQRSEGFGSNFTSAMKRAGASVTSALTIKPRVIPANDPIKLSSDPGKINAELYISAARIHEQRGNLPAAKQQYQRALEVDKNNLKAILSLARIHDRMEEFDEAIELYRAAISSNPDSDIALNDLALCLARQGDLQSSVRTMRQAVQMQPTKKLYRNNLATVLVETGQYREAFDHLAIVHGAAIAHYNLGYFLYQREKYEQATQHFAQAVEIDPNLTAARRMLQQLSSTPPLNRQSNNSNDGSYEVKATAIIPAEAILGKQFRDERDVDSSQSEELDSELLTAPEELTPSEPARLLAPIVEANPTQ